MNKQLFNHYDLMEDCNKVQNPDEILYSIPQLFSCQRALSIPLAIICLITSIFYIYLFQTSFKTIKKIKNLSPFVQKEYKQTYCIISVYLIIAAQVNLIFLFFNHIIFSILLFITYYKKINLGQFSKYYDKFIITISYLRIIPMNMIYLF